jgi:singapore isolate B (sub-type 7) whole genome shotgun sequence assembly, scaffold_8
MSNSATSVEDELDRMWKTQVDSVQSGTSTIKDLDIIVVDDKKDFKKHNDLPIARIKRIMKSDQDVRMISAETPVIFARACEMFIMDITIRSTQFAEYDNERLVLTKKSILDTIKNTDIFDFLMEIR